MEVSVELLLTSSVHDTKRIAGLTVEQRKRGTIGVELAVSPEITLFLDEPTSGLDSDTAWSICTFLRKLADNGLAVLCTIHQPSGILFQILDRLLFLFWSMTSRCILVT